MRWMTAKKLPSALPKRGQVWRSRDPRAPKRRIVVRSVYLDGMVLVTDPDGRRRRLVSIGAFRPISRGYELVQNEGDVPKG